VLSTGSWARATAARAAATVTDLDGVPARV
jgi:hypothetical protein